MGKGCVGGVDSGGFFGGFLFQQNSLPHSAGPKIIHYVQIQVPIEIIFNRFQFILQTSVQEIL